ncbi:hypothetical protein GN244_ATG01053 [Phytophthora infestans]|nr:hypothetical protein GN244_ATG01053 [Phytophthora infestans]
MTKKFHTQRERERVLIQTLMLGKYPERQHKTIVVEKEQAGDTTPRQHLNADLTGIRARVATPDRVFRKVDVTGGVPRTKPHAHKCFKLPGCNGSPGNRLNAREQDAASIKLSSPPRHAPRETTAVTNGLSTRTKRPPSLSATESSVRSPSVRVQTSSETAASSSQRVQSPYTSLHRHQTRSAKATAQLSSLPDKPDEKVSLLSTGEDIGEPQEESFVDFEGALSFSEAQQFAESMRSDAQLLEEKVLAEFATQTTPRLLGDVTLDHTATKTSPRPELAQVDTTLVATTDGSVSTPRRPQSVRAQQSTRQSFLESLARDDKIF